MTNRLRIALGISMFHCLGCLAEAVVIYTDIPDTGVFGISGDVLLDVDVDGNGDVDFVFRSNFAPGDGFVILPQGANTTFSTAPAPPDVNTFAIDFDHGVEIGPSILGGSSVTLTGQQFDVLGREIGPGLLACALFTELVCLGQFDSDEALGGGDPTDFVGIALKLDGRTHFGYIEVLSSGFNGGTILSFAYESEPDTPIIAGAVPEPNSVVCLFLGSLLGLTRRRRG